MKKLRFYVKIKKLISYSKLSLASQSKTLIMLTSIIQVNNSCMSVINLLHFIKSIHTTYRMDAFLI